LNPDIAVISAGRDNKFGHPHDDVIAVLENEEVRILRTDRMGTIKVVSDGNDIYY
jgi:competence protein ComEC